MASHDDAETPLSTSPAPSETGGPGEGFVRRDAILIVVILMTLLAALLLYTLWAFWPDTGLQGKTAPPPQHIDYFGWKPHIGRESLFFLTVAIAGALGGLIHTIRSIAWYVGNRSLRWSWLSFNLTLPIVGALAGTVFYLVLRAGLFSPSTSAESVSPFGFAAVAVLAGLFSEQAMEKLRQVASQLFQDSRVGADHVDPEAPPKT